MKLSPVKGRPDWRPSLTCEATAPNRLQVVHVHAVLGFMEGFSLARFMLPPNPTWCDSDRLDLSGKLVALDITGEQESKGSFNLLGSSRVGRCRARRESVAEGKQLIMFCLSLALEIVRQNVSAWLLAALNRRP